jgi:hypothetical protein
LLQHWNTQLSTFHNKCQTRIFTRPGRNQLTQNIEIERENKSSLDWRIGLHLYSPSLNSTRIWRVWQVIICTVSIVMGLKIWSLSNPGFEPATFWSLAQWPYTLTNCASRAHKNSSKAVSTVFFFFFF